jgi:predicted O-methyltransferase YrrM
VDPLRWRIGKQLDILFARLLDVSPAVARHAREDDAALAAEHPQLAPLARVAAECRRELEPSYAEYVRDVSSPVFAASLELAATLLALCRLLEPRSVLDMGSGYSSYVFLRYVQSAGGGVRVESVDDKAAWLKKTRAYVASHGLPVDGIGLWDDLLARRPEPFDLVSHDMALMDRRAGYLPDALRLTRPGGFLVLDDVHKLRYRRVVRRFVSAHGIRAYDLRNVTHDHYRRHAFLLAVPDGQAPATAR